MILKNFLTIGFVLTVLVACGDDSGSNSVAVPWAYVDPSTVVKGTMTDERDGQTYKTVKIGTQTWMAENLNYAYTSVPYKYNSYTSDSTSWCYNNDLVNCTKFGRLYTWAAAMDSTGTWTTNGKKCGKGRTCLPTYPVRGICPEGWHLPDSTEWKMLFAAVGGTSTAGKMLKSTSGWDRNGNGTDAYSFAALPTGYRTYEGVYFNDDLSTSFWSSTEKDVYRTYKVYVNYGKDTADLEWGYKGLALSVRCVKD